MLKTATAFVEVPVMVKKTAEKGRFIINSLPAGIYTVNINKNCYAEHTEMLAISNGELAVLNVQLTKN